MTQAKAARHPRRGSENRARRHQVKVALTDSELAALDHARAPGQSRPEMLRTALSAALLSGPPPSPGSIRRYLTERGWVQGEPGMAGALWRRDGWEIGVPHEVGPQEWYVSWGAVKRIARAEGRPQPDVARDMIAGTDA